MTTIIRVYDTDPHAPDCQPTIRHSDKTHFIADMLADQFRSFCYVRSSMHVASVPYKGKLEMFYSEEA